MEFCKLEAPYEWGAFLIHQISIKMNILEFFKIRESRSSIAKRIELYEEENSIKLPPIYKTFLKTFKLKELGTVNFLYYVHPEHKTKVPFWDSQYVNDSDINLVDLIELENSISTFHDIFEEDDEVFNLNIILIGECSDQKLLLLGIGEDNKDGIFIYDHFSDNPIRKISNNIFEFFQDHKLSANESRLPEKVKVDRLYKNWNEDFWRIKGK